MDIQLKKGLLDICVLACIKRGESYGYQIIKDLEAVVEISESTLYPILKRFEAGGLVQTRETPHNGRLRKYFSITPSGISKLHEFKKGQAEITKICNYIKEQSHE